MRRHVHLTSILLLTALTAGVASHDAPASNDDLIPADGSCWKQFAPRPSKAPAGELRKQDTGYTLTLASGGSQTHRSGGMAFPSTSIPSASEV